MSTNQALHEPSTSLSCTRREPAVCRISACPVQPEGYAAQFLLLLADCKMECTLHRCCGLSIDLQRKKEKQKKSQRSIFFSFSNFAVEFGSDNVSY
jgi:hypothetical protein